MRANWIIAVVSAFMCSLPAAAGHIIIDVASFDVGQDISHATPGVVLSKGYPNRLPVIVEFVSCLGDARLPPACDRKALTNAAGSTFDTWVEPMLRLEFDAPVTSLRVRGFSNAGSDIYLETRVLDLDELVCACGPGYEIFAGGKVSGSHLAALYDLTAVPSPGINTRTFLIGSASAFYPTRIDAYVPTPASAAPFLLLLAGLATVRRRASFTAR